MRAALSPSLPPHCNYSSNQVCIPKYHGYPHYVIMYITLQLCPFNLDLMQFHFMQF
jgi:hypothetical protein